MAFEKQFNRLAKTAAHWTGRPSCFVLSVAVILVWALLGPVFHYSDTWQLVVNTATTIITFLMVFLIQNTQNRDTGAIQIKLDELIRAVHGAKNDLLCLEDMDDADIEQLRKEYEALAVRARETLHRKGRSAAACPTCGA